MVLHEKVASLPGIKASHVLWLMVDQCLLWPGFCTHPHQLPEAGRKIKRNGRVLKRVLWDWTPGLIYVTCGRWFIDNILKAPNLECTEVFIRKAPRTRPSEARENLHSQKVCVCYLSVFSPAPRTLGDSCWIGNRLFISDCLTTSLSVDMKKP